MANDMKIEVCGAYGHEARMTGVMRARQLLQPAISVRAHAGDFEYRSDGNMNE